MAVALPLDNPPPNRDTYVRVTLAQLWDNLPLILLAACVFSLFCAPAALAFYLGLLVPAAIVGALTIAPAWVALLALEADIVRDRRASIGAMLQALPRFWRRSAGLGLLAGFPLLAGLLTLPNLALAEVPPVVWVGLAGDGIGMIILLAVSIYAVPLLVLHDMSLGTALRNALLLTGRHIANTVGLLSMVVVLGLAILYISSALAFFLPAVWGIFLVNNCRMVVAEELTASPPA